MISPKRNKTKKSKEIKEIEDNIKFLIHCMNTLTETIKTDQKTIQYLIEKVESLEHSKPNEMMYH